MNISIIGIGYVGLVTGTVFADLGHKVFCVDIDKKKIESLKKGLVPFFEPGLKELVKQNISSKRLIFTTDYLEAIPISEIVFICVGTPAQENGEANLSYLFSATEEIAKHIKKYTLIVLKSTVTIGIDEKLEKIIKKITKTSFEIASCPEFLKEGSALEDAQNPDRTIIGTKSQKATDLLLDLYKHMDKQILVCDLRSAQMIKYAANSFLATKISFANAVANLAEKLGADVETVLQGVGLDKRIGRHFLYPGIGFGGSCFPKDLSAFIDIAKNVGYKFELLEAVSKINNQQIDLFIEKIIKMVGPVKNKTLAILGIAFKPNTDDIREAPSIKIIQKLLKMGVKIQTYDPQAMENAKKIFGNQVIFAKNSYDAIKDAHALLLITEWNEFKELDLEKVKSLLKEPIILDGRNIYDPEKVKALGFKYQGIGRN